MVARILPSYLPQGGVPQGRNAGMEGGGCRRFAQRRRMRGPLVGALGGASASLNRCWTRGGQCVKERGNGPTGVPMCMYGTGRYAYCKTEHFFLKKKYTHLKQEK